MQLPHAVCWRALNVASPGECGLCVRARIEVGPGVINVDMRHQRGHLWTTATTKAGFGYSCSRFARFGPWLSSTSSRRKDFNAPHHLDHRRRPPR